VWAMAASWSSRGAEGVAPIDDEREHAGEDRVVDRHHSEHHDEDHHGVNHLVDHAVKHESRRDCVVDRHHSDHHVEDHHGVNHLVDHAEEHESQRDGVGEQHDPRGVRLNLDSGHLQQQQQQRLSRSKSLDGCCFSSDAVPVPSPPSEDAAGLPSLSAHHQAHEECAGSPPPSAPLLLRLLAPWKASPASASTNMHARTQSSSGGGGGGGGGGSVGGMRESHSVASALDQMLARPSNLPPKSAAEERRHRAQVDELLELQRRRDEELARRREARERDVEEAIARWNNDILPNWLQLRDSRRVHDLIWRGIPSAVRPRAWPIIAGNRLHLTADLYEISLARARIVFDSGSADDHADDGLSREQSVRAISLDVSRTFAPLGIFQAGAPYHERLRDVLLAFGNYRPDIGYVQGMSFLACMLLLYLEPAEAFICLANIMANPLHMAFYRVDHEQVCVRVLAATLVVIVTLSVSECIPRSASLPVCLPCVASHLHSA
jgi:hypothetical protein